MKPVVKFYGKKLREKRDRKGATRQEWATALGWGFSTLGEHERSHVGSMERNNFRDLASLLDVSMDELRREIGASDDVRTDREIREEKESSAPTSTRRLKGPKALWDRLDAMVSAEKTTGGDVAISLLEKLIAAGGSASLSPDALASALRQFAIDSTEPQRESAVAELDPKTLKALADFFARAVRQRQLSATTKPGEKPTRAGDSHRRVTG